MLIVAKRLHFQRQPQPLAMHDTGMALANLMLQATSMESIAPMAG
jgi:hypothetical protein